MPEMQTSGIQYLDELEALKQKNDEKYKKRREKELNDLTAVLRTVEGRRFVWRILTESMLFCTTFSGNDPLTQSRNEGKKDVGYMLINDVMSSNPQLFIQMQNEYISKQKQELADEKKLPEKEDQ